MLGPDGKALAGKPVIVFEHGEKAALLIQPHTTGDARLEGPDQIYLLEAGGWMVVDAGVWARMVQQVVDAQQVLAASSKAGRQARKRMARVKRCD